MPYNIGVVLLPLILLALSGSSLDSKIASVVPRADEDRWLSVDWRTNLMAARREAQEKGKPLFLWIMNGSPLGCT